MLDIINQIPDRQIKLNQEQRLIIEHEKGPLWVVAGPGAGKTEVLVLYCLKLLCVNQVDPKSIIITTFTQKAARNLLNRIELYRSHLEKCDRSIEKIDLANLRIGTMHSLCNDIMLDYRHEDYTHLELIDEIEESFFIYDFCDLTARSQEADQFWSIFDFMFDRNRAFMPSKWEKTFAIMEMFRGIVENYVDIRKMAGKESSRLLAKEYLKYLKILREQKKCDLAHLQRIFLKFLDKNLERIVYGDEASGNPGIDYVLVDEYQDTNPIQEEIYLKLADKPPHNLAVVGDDDQALYRFRGGTVDCMVNFDQACQRAWNIDPREVKKVVLNKNYRSHPGIVKWCNDYLTSFEAMKKKGARSSLEKALLATKAIQRSYPAVSIIMEEDPEALAERFAEIIKDLIDHKILNTPGDSALLGFSTRENDRWMGPYARAVRKHGIRFENPRSRRFLSRPEIAACMGALIEIIDPNLKILHETHSGKIKGLVEDWVRQYHKFSKKYSALKEYVARTKNRIAVSKPNEWIYQAELGKETNEYAVLLDILYHIYNHEPFIAYQADPEKMSRMAHLIRMFESFSSIPIARLSEIGKGRLRSSQSGGEIDFNWRRSFYYNFCGYLAYQGMNDPETEVETSPDAVPFMTIHQAKGLEFPLVFVTGLDLNLEPSSEHFLEEYLRQFTHRPVTFTPEERRIQDIVRLFYVAYSRAQEALVLLATREQIERRAIGININGVGKMKILAKTR